MQLPRQALHLELVLDRKLQLETASTHHYVLHLPAKVALQGEASLACSASRLFAPTQGAYGRIHVDMHLNQHQIQACHCLSSLA